ncbi:MAG TPA: hypothetical protein VL357_00725 [Rariglobus sp.]|jgi:hypothetical protein|nr:hypothetical protein [Rariglobus sp.]
MEAERVKIAWIMGWAVPRDWFAAQVSGVFILDEHVFFEPKDTVLTELEAHGPFDCVAGYSLGAHLLLAEALRAERLCARVVLLAPFLAFPADEKSGGRVARTQVRYLVRWVRRDREAALADFYARAGLNEVTPEMASGITMETLLAGLAQLENGRATPVMRSGWKMFIGGDDSLLDAKAVVEQLPEAVTVDGATHHPRALLVAWREEQRL